MQEIFSRKPASVKTKSEFYNLYHNGFFGNKVRTWNSYKDILKDNYNGQVSIRSKDIGWKTLFNINVKDVPEILNDLKQKNNSISKFMFSETPPDNKMIFQGEIKRTEKGLYFYYSDLKLPMSIALKKKSKIIIGIRVLNMLKQNLDSVSYEDIMDILNLFPDDVIEFSCFNCSVGVIPGRNTIIGEVRGY